MSFGEPRRPEQLPLFPGHTPDRDTLLSMRRRKAFRRAIEETRAWIAGGRIGPEPRWPRLDDDREAGKETDEARLT